MNINTPGDQANKFVDQAAQSAREALLGGQRLAHATVDGASRQLDLASEKADALAHRASEALHRGTKQLRERAHQAGDSTVGYIRDEPVKAVLMAAATGVAFAVLLRWLARNRD